MMIDGDGKGYSAILLEMRGETDELTPSRACALSESVA